MKETFQNLLINESILEKSKADMHAELKLIDFLVKNLEFLQLRKFYLVISKKYCIACSFIIYNLNQFKENN